MINKQAIVNWRPSYLVASYKRYRIFHNIYYYGENLDVGSIFLVQFENIEVRFGSLKAAIQFVEDEALG